MRLNSSWPNWKTWWGRSRPSSMTRTCQTPSSGTSSVPFSVLTPMTTTDWLSPSEAGALLGVGPDRIAQLARDGTLTSMRTPGNHVRVRRDEVEQLLKDGEDPPQPVTRQPGNRGTDSIPDVSPPPPRPKWEEVPPWQRRVREAEADVHVLELDDQRQRLMESREQRQAERDRAESRRASQAAEN